MNDLERGDPTEPERDVPAVGLGEAFEAVVGSPNTASKRWVYRQYDHEVQTRTALRPGDDAALLAVREADLGLALAAGADPNWTAAAPYEGARAVTLESATNVAAKGAEPLAAVDCLNGGNPENPEVYGGFAAVVDGLADMCATLDVPIVGGNVSLYNDSAAGPIPPTPTLALVGTKEGYDAPTLSLDGEGDLFVVGDRPLAGDVDPGLGGSEFLAQCGGHDAFPALPEAPAALVTTLKAVADRETTLATHDVSHGGLAVTLAEMVSPGVGAEVTLEPSAPFSLFHEQPGRVVVETTAPDKLRAAFDGVAPVTRLGTSNASGTLSLAVGAETLEVEAETLADWRDPIAETLDG